MHSFTLTDDATGIRCGSCKGRHGTVAGVRACHTGHEVGPCDWLVRRGISEDGEEIILECGADAWTTAREWACVHGHNHVSAQQRYEESWEYAHDHMEAENLARQGVHPMRMDGDNF